MSRTIDHVARISDSFDAMDPMTQSDIVAELFSRLEDVTKQATLRRIDFHARMAGLLPREPRRVSRGRNGDGPLLDAEDPMVEEETLKLRIQSLIEKREKP